MIRTFLNDPNQTVEGGLALYNKYQADPSFLATRAANSAALFKTHFKENYVEASVPAAAALIADFHPSKTRSTAVGIYLTSPFAGLLVSGMLGGYLARKHDPPPGNMVVWRGMTRLHDIAFGISIGSTRRCG